MRRAGLVALPCLAALAACAATPATRSGFLGDYREMRTEDSRDRILVQRPPADFVRSLYGAVRIAEPVIAVPDLPAPDAARLAAALRDALAVELSSATGSGKPVLEVRSAITGARKANVIANVATSLLALPVSAGGVSAEAEIVDVASGRRIAALSWSRRGGAFKDFGAAYSRYGQARAGLHAFARRFAGLVEPAAPVR